VRNWEVAVIGILGGTILWLAFSGLLEILYPYDRPPITVEMGK
jgi:hypothetical protein